MPRLKLNRDGTYSIDGLTEEQVHAILRSLVAVGDSNPSEGLLKIATGLFNVLDDDYYSEQPIGETK